MDIREALQQLDPQDDAHWTVGGDPKLDALIQILGEHVTRKEVIEAAPRFTRENPLLDEEDEVTVEENPEVQLAEAARALNEAKAKLSEATAKVDAKIMAEEAEKEPAHVLNMRNIQEYLNRQRQNKLERVEHRRELLGKIDPRDLQVLAPIDAAMQRKTARGVQRPQRQVKSETGG